eukprot:gene8688-biopygen6972
MPTTAVSRCTQFPDSNRNKQKRPKRKCDAIVILDDLMDEMTKNDKMSQFFTRESHHRNLCMFFVWQDIFPKHKHGSTISKNTDYKIIFDNPSCRDSVRRMLGKMYPKAKQAGEVAQKIFDALEYSPSNSYPFVSLNCRPNEPSETRIVSNLISRNMDDVRYQFPANGAATVIKT